MCYPNQKTKSNLNNLKIVQQMKNIFITSLVLLLGMAGCSEYQMTKYEDDPAIYFHWSRNYQDWQLDSINFSFFTTKYFIEDTVWVRVNAMGQTAPVDRPISIVQTNTSKPGAAVSGTHFLSFDNAWIKEKWVIPANETSARIPIVLFNHADLTLQEVRLELAIAQNNHFRPGINHLRNFIVTSTAQAVKPSTWDTYWHTYFGATFGTVKFRFMIDATGYFDWETRPLSDYTLYLRDMTRQKFQEYNLNNPGNPLREANGDLVIFLPGW
jgi:hypothetical protein